MGMKLDPEMEAKVLAMCGLAPKAAAPEPMPPEISEAGFQAKVIEYAESRGWIVYHTYNSRRSQKGYPDLSMVRERHVYAELKDESGTLTKDQKKWRDALLAAGEEWYCWRPSDWPQIVEVLK